eukprot:TRINITY_DN11054_c0_g1_i1.p1 TRINITY_DN11054_c0_g1~~TRINITY_DN11054_c0_g1_i1.p1  ORF type:complete len:453 (+),score=121.19 TRINITY_DN11054_c0_g1_i1:95-1453(+)
MEVKGHGMGGHARGGMVMGGRNQLGGPGGMGQMGMGQHGMGMNMGMGGMMMGGGYGYSPTSAYPQQHDQHAQYGLMQQPHSATQQLSSTDFQPNGTFGDGNDAVIVDVWADQLEAAFDRIRATVVDYPFVAMDTEFPGVVARPVGNFKSNTEFYYQTLRCNVNLLKIIQLGITFSNENGEHPPGPCTWQFNFKFNLTDDIYAQDSIDLLTDSGIDFDRFAREGIEVATFAELLTSSGLVLSSDPPVRWLSFHSGYDFGYLIKVLTSSELPSEEEEFFELMNTYFPLVYDVKYLLKQTNGLLSDMCGLNKLGEDLNVQRIGPAHQAGSDSLLTAHCFFKLSQEFFPDDSISKHRGVLYGLGQDKGSEVGQGHQNGWTNPAITPSTPSGGNANGQPSSHTNTSQQQQNGGGGGAAPSGGVGGGAPPPSSISQFPSSPSAPLQRGPQPGLYSTMR